MQTRRCRVVLGTLGTIASAGAFAWAGGGLRDDLPLRSPEDPESAPTGQSVEGPAPAVTFGDPLPGLSAADMLRFLEGKEQFLRVRQAPDGLGPIMNKDSCGGCHSIPAAGGAGSIFVTRFGRLVGKGEFDPMAEFGGSLLQALAVTEGCSEQVPAEAFSVHRITTPMFGAGLIEAIDDATLLALEDPDDVDGDGISGRAHVVFDPYEQQMRVGRFGWKAQVATLATFSADAGLNEMGITSVLFPEENDPNGILPPGLARCDLVADPEDEPDENGVSDFERIGDFQRFLAPPRRLPMLNSRGLALFRQIGCDDCHRPVMITGNHEVPALSRKPAFLYSDLLLHDMGTLGDEIVQGDAGGTEMRTPPLWGVRTRPALLHDGRFNDANPSIRIRQAIEAHEGEGAASRDTWLALPLIDKALVLRFLNSI